jgi:hypothetical protein
MSQYISLVKASYDYTASSEDELSIHEDQLYFLLDKSDPDWYKIQLKSDNDDEPSGLVPATYVEEVPPIATAIALYDYAATGAGELSISENELVYVLEKDEDWWLIKTDADGGRVGLVPGNYIEERVRLYPIPAFVDSSALSTRITRLQRLRLHQHRKRTAR